MTRRSVFFVAAIAVLLAASPLLHQHPLGSLSSDGAVGSASTCVVCAAGVQRLPSAAPAIVAPQTLVFQLSAPATSGPIRGTDLFIPSRAPPSA